MFFSFVEALLSLYNLIDKEVFAVAVKVAPKKRYFDKEEFVEHDISTVLVGCGRLGSVLANKARKPMIIIDKDKDAFNRLKNPDRHVLVNRDIRDPEAMAHFENKARVIMAIDDFPTAVYAGLCARTVHSVPRVFVYSKSDSVTLRSLKLRAYDEDGTDKF